MTLPKQSIDIEQLKKTLHSNQALQREISRQLEEIARRKAANRQKASLLTRRLVRTLDGPAFPLPVGINAYRNTTEKFFVDKKGKEPEPNQDTIWRSKLEAQTFLFHRQPPWSGKESKNLAATVHQQFGAEPSSSLSSSSIDFEKVAAALSSPRTAEECRIQYRRLNHKPVAFTKEESLQISQCVHTATQKGEIPDWQQIASNFAGRTAWDCLVAYQTKIEPVRSEPWTPQEDELLFKFVAAAGPQCVLDKNFGREVVTNILPNKSKKAVLMRVNQSILNPKLKHEDWSVDEERRLVVLMKMYSDSPRDLSLAMTHFDRASKSVMDKWRRGLNPAYLSTPFSKEEDKALMEVVRSLGNNIGWKELSEKHFPDRHPQRLMNRWNELASDQDILQREGNFISGPNGKRKGIIFGVSNNPLAADSSLAADAFVVQVKKKSKR